MVKTSLELAANNQLRYVLLYEDTTLKDTLVLNDAGTNVLKDNVPLNSLCCN